MKRYRQALRQALGSPGFPAAALAMAAALSAACLEALLPLLHSGTVPVRTDYLLGILRAAASSETVCLCLPVAAALPFAASYYDELHSGFVKAALPRAGYRRYIAGKAAACFASGVLAPAAGIVGFGALVGIALAGRLTWEAGVLREVAALLGQSVPVCLSGGLWALVGLTASAWTDSKHMAYAAPFVLFYVLVILSERCWKKAVFLNPKGWMAPGGGNMLLLGVLSALTAAAFCRCAGRRLRNL